MTEVIWLRGSRFEKPLFDLTDSVPEQRLRALKRISKQLWEEENEVGAQYADRLINHLSAELDYKRDLKRSGGFL